MDEKAVKKPHMLMLESRNKLSFSGVTQIGAFDEEMLTVYTDYGEITVNGETKKVYQSIPLNVLLERKLELIEE